LYNKQIKSIIITQGFSVDFVLMINKMMEQVKIDHDRHLVRPIDDLQRYGPYWKMIAKCASRGRFTGTAKLFWRELSVGPCVGQRSLNTAAKKVRKCVDAKREGRIPFDHRCKRSWPVVVYDTDDEIHIPIDDYDLYHNTKSNEG
jgi:hypothetical protein